jgi:hypothetical protein
MHRWALPFPGATGGPLLCITWKGRHAYFLHVVSSEQYIVRNAGDTGITRSGPLPEMSTVSSQYFSPWNHQRSKGDERQQKDNLPMDRERARDHLSNSQRPTTRLLQFAIQRRR